LWKLLQNGFASIDDMREGDRAGHTSNGKRYSATAVARMIA
jgi:hypothetical protein